MAGDRVGETSMAQRVEASERPMLALALVAVALYLGDLLGLWASWGVRGVYVVAAVVVDVLFVLDLVVKIAVLRGPYLRSPWCVVDLVCALPLLATVGAAPSALQGLRFVRAFRILRALRMLRVLRSLRILRVVASSNEETRESATYQRVLTGAVIAYAVAFVGLVSAVRSGASSVAAADAAELHLVVGSLLGMALILVVTRYQIPDLFSRQMKALLNVALPEQVAQRFLEHPESYDESVRMPATVVFCDIKGFTSTVEKVPLDELKGHLERALDAVVEAHRGQDLIIDKFIGDAVMSFRGGTIAGGPPEDIAYRVVRGALDGVRALAELGDPYFHEVKVGGASAEDALIGAFGTSRRLSYTVLGDRVNLAARLEGACNALGVTNLFCDRTQALTADRPDLTWRRIGRIRVQGKEEATVTWQAFDPAYDDTSWIPRWHRALDAWEAARFAEAADHCRAVLSVRDDGPARTILQRAQAAVDQGPPADWTPVLETRK